MSKYWTGSDNQRVAKHEIMAALKNPARPVLTKKEADNRWVSPDGGENWYAVRRPTFWLCSLIAGGTRD